MRPFSKAIDRLIQKRKTQQSETQTVMAPVTRAEMERVFAYELHKATSTLSKYKLYGIIPKSHANQNMRMEAGE